MCSIITTGPCQCQAKAGVTTDDVLGVIGVLGALAGIAVVGAVVQAAPGFFALVGLSMLALAPNRSRRWAGHWVRWLLREMWRTWTTRHERPAPASTAVALPQPWRVALYPAGQPAIEGTITGTWSNAAELQAIAKDRYRERTGFVGELRCVAEPL